MPVQVHGYTEDILERSNCHIVSAVVAYDHPASGDVYMLVRLCPMQLRDHGLAVNDEPKYMALNPTEEHHAITVHDHKIHDREPLCIPLELQRGHFLLSFKKAN